MHVYVWWSSCVSVMRVASASFDLPKACNNTANEEDAISLDERR